MPTIQGATRKTSLNLPIWDLSSQYYLQVIHKETVYVIKSADQSAWKCRRRDSFHGKMQAFDTKGTVSRKEMLCGGDIKEFVRFAIWRDIGLLCDKEDWEFGV